MEDGIAVNVAFVFVVIRGREATTEISQPRSGWNEAKKTFSVPEGRWKWSPTNPKAAFHRPFRTDLPLQPVFQPLRGWLISFGPAGPLERRRVVSPKIFFIVLHAMLLKERHVFLLKGFLAVMFLLVGDVFLDGIHIGNTHGERAVALLPREILHVNRLMNPSR